MEQEVKKPLLAEVVKNKLFSMEKKQSQNIAI